MLGRCTSLFLMYNSMEFWSFCSFFDSQVPLSLFFKLKNVDSLLKQYCMPTNGHIFITPLQVKQLVARTRGTHSSFFKQLKRAGKFEILCALHPKKEDAKALVSLVERYRILLKFIFLCTVQLAFCFCVWFLSYVLWPCNWANCRSVEFVDTSFLSTFHWLFCFAQPECLGTADFSHFLEPTMGLLCLLFLFFHLHSVKLPHLCFFRLSQSSMCCQYLNV